mmetsp:Transcript_70667/g.118116  ORF Transcript_70667/g.118116 Transcript_70667/m.118116 type:complete len:382 (-) Transcript_70667:1047-2192(-)
MPQRSRWRARAGSEKGNRPGSHGFRRMKRQGHQRNSRRHRLGPRPQQCLQPTPRQRLAVTGRIRRIRTRACWVRQRQPQPALRAPQRTPTATLKKCGGPQPNAAEEEQDLIRYVRFPYIPWENKVLQKAMKSNAVPEDLLDEKWQSDSGHRRLQWQNTWTPHPGDPFRRYVPRVSEQLLDEIEHIVRQNEIKNERRWDARGWLNRGRRTRRGARMLAHTSGRCGFERLQWDEAKEPPLDRDVVKGLLLHERHLRLAPESLEYQDELRHSEDAVFLITEALQREALRACGLPDDPTSLRLLQSVLTMYPEDAEIQALPFYERYNRCRQGNLKVGDSAPLDIPLATLEGEAVTLAGYYRTQCAAMGVTSDPLPPLVLIAGSIT